MQVGGVLSLSVSDRESPRFTVLTGTQRARRPACLCLIAGNACHSLSMPIYISHAKIDDALVATLDARQSRNSDRCGEKETSVHGKSCAESRRPPSECDCSCRGLRHGERWRTASPPAQPAPAAPEVRVARPRRGKGRRVAAFAVGVTVTGTFGVLAVTGTFNGSSNGGNLSVKVNVDLGRAIKALSSLGFGGRSNSGTSVPSYRADCAESATRQVKQFLAHYPCKQYAAETWTIARPGTATQVAFSWVEMPTVSLADQYKAIVDNYSTGNPPGVSLAFNGLCYSSGQQGSTVWAVEVQPIGNKEVDRKILQAATPRSLPPDYLRQHCAK
jgi:hypothetical protein